MRVRGGLLFRGGVAQMVAHVADQIGSDATLHEAPLPVATREAVLVPTADDRFRGWADCRFALAAVTGNLASATRS